MNIKELQIALINTINPRYAHIPVFYEWEDKILAANDVNSILKIVNDFIKLMHGHINEILADFDSRVPLVNQPSFTLLQRILVKIHDINQVLFETIAQDEATLLEYLSPELKNIYENCLIIDSLDFAYGRRREEPAKKNEDELLMAAKGNEKTLISDLKKLIVVYLMRIEQFDLGKQFLQSLSEKILEAIAKLSPEDQRPFYMGLAYSNTYDGFTIDAGPNTSADYEAGEELFLSEPGGNSFLKFYINRPEDEITNYSCLHFLSDKANMKKNLSQLFTGDFIFDTTGRMIYLPHELSILHEFIHLMHNLSGINLQNGFFLGQFFNQGEMQYVNIWGNDEETMTICGGVIERLEAGKFRIRPIVDRQTTTAADTSNPNRCLGEHDFALHMGCTLRNSHAPNGTPIPAILFLSNPRQQELLSTPLQQIIRLAGDIQTHGFRF